jgi:hypothetical protein
LFVGLLFRLRDVAAAAQHASFPEQLLQRRLLDQLQALPWLTELNPQQLLEEYRALQMMVLYNGDSWSGTQEQSRAEKDAVPDVGPGHVRRDQGSKKKGGRDEEMEEFLVQQVGLHVRHGARWDQAALLKARWLGAQLISNCPCALLLA